VTATHLNIKRILCPVDFSEFSAPALEHATRLARLFGARLVVLHVIPPFPALHEGTGFPWVANPEELARTQRQRAEWELQHLVEPLAGQRVPMETKVVEGDAARSIGAMAAALPADLIVVGTHGQGGFEQFVLGSVAEKVIRSAPCGVLAVGKVSREPGNGAFRRILCALDLTQASAHTLHTALALAVECSATLTLLHILEGFSVRGGPHFPVGLPDLAPLRRDVGEQALAALRKAVPDDAIDRGALVFRVESGSPWREIVRVAAETKADLVVVGAHARGRGGNSFLGSTSSQVVRHAPCPVLVLREGS